jgi:hypothetical protein
MAWVEQNRGEEAGAGAGDNRLDDAQSAMQQKQSRAETLVTQLYEGTGNSTAMSRDEIEREERPRSRQMFHV